MHIKDGRLLMTRKQLRTIYRGTLLVAATWGASAEHARQKKRAIELDKAYQRGRTSVRFEYEDRVKTLEDQLTIYEQGRKI